MLPCRVATPGWFSPSAASPIFRDCCTSPIAFSYCPCEEHTEGHEVVARVTAWVVLAELSQFDLQILCCTSNAFS